MKRILSILTIVMLVAGVTSCKKRKAEKALRGQWNIVAYDLYLQNNCGDYQDNLYDYSGNHGTADFEKKEVNIDVDIEGLNDACYDDLSLDLNGKWKITEHNRELLLLHTYTMEMEGKTWTVSFHSDTRGTYTKADKSINTVYMEASTSDGGALELTLERI